MTSSLLTAAIQACNSKLSSSIINNSQCATKRVRAAEPSPFKQQQNKNLHEMNRRKKNLCPDKSYLMNILKYWIQTKKQQ